MKIQKISFLLAMSIVLSIPVSADVKTTGTNKGLYYLIQERNEEKVHETGHVSNDMKTTGTNKGLYNMFRERNKDEIACEISISVSVDTIKDEVNQLMQNILHGKTDEEKSYKIDIPAPAEIVGILSDCLKDILYKDDEEENLFETDHSSSAEIMNDEAENVLQNHKENDEDNSYEMYRERKQNVVKMRWDIISINEAEEIVSLHGYTVIGSKRFILNSEEVYAVYTYNPSSYGKPYLVHYVDLEGYYINNEETYLPYGLLGDKNPDNLFDYMESVIWSGTVILHDGSLKNVTVPVMKDNRTGMYYLGDVERKIAVADTWTFLYGDDLTIVSSQNNNGWYGADLIAYSNYIKAYDFFKDEIEPNAVLLLKNYVDMDRVPKFYDGYLGDVGEWTCFSLGYKSNQNEYLDRVTHHYAEWVLTEILGTDMLNDLHDSLCDVFGYIAGAKDSANPGLIGKMSDRGTVSFGLTTYVNPYISIESSLARKAVEYMNRGMTIDQAKEFWTQALDHMTKEMDEQDVLDMADRLIEEYEFELTDIWYKERMQGKTE